MHNFYDLIADLVAMAGFYLKLVDLAEKHDLHLSYPAKFYRLFDAQYLYSTFTNGSLLGTWLIGSPP